MNGKKAVCVPSSGSSANRMPAAPATPNAATPYRRNVFARFFFEITTPIHLDGISPALRRLAARWARLLTLLGNRQTGRQGEVIGIVPMASTMSPGQKSVIVRVGFEFGLFMQTACAVSGWGSQRKFLPFQREVDPKNEAAR